VLVETAPTVAFFSFLSTSCYMPPSSSGRGHLSESFFSLVVVMFSGSLLQGMCTVFYLYGEAHPPIFFYSGGRGLGVFPILLFGVGGVVPGVCWFAAVAYALLCRSFVGWWVVGHLPGVFVPCFGAAVPWSVPLEDFASLLVSASGGFSAFVPSRKLFLFYFFLLIHVAGLWCRFPFRDDERRVLLIKGLPYF